jgi:UPF0755 protein
MARSRRLFTKRPGRSTGIKVVWIAFWSVLLAGVLALAWFDFDTDRVVLPRDSSKPLVELVIPYGTSAKGIASQLQRAGLDIDQTTFLLHARWLGVHRKLQAGVYLAEPGITQRQMIMRLSRQDPTQTELRVLEGWTFAQTLSAIARNPHVESDIAVVRTGRDLAVSLGVPAEHPEGWIYPESYVVPKGYSGKALLERAVRLQKAALEAAWQSRDTKVPYRDPYQALIVASIVEKETQFPGDRERVAAVFANRLNLGMPLQADPTVIYGMGSRFQGKITKKDLRRDTPFNTYTRKTLPPTPISNPGRAALKAVMSPANTQDIFFVARGDGSSQFSENLREHNQAVNQFIRKLP